jgi:hypothetical protein
VDRLVSAILEVRLRAYAGRGKVASSNGERWTPMQHIQVTQLYIPGLYRKGANPQLFERAFPDPRFEYGDTTRNIVFALPQVHQTKVCRLELAI